MYGTSSNSSRRSRKRRRPSTSDDSDSDLEVLPNIPRPRGRVRNKRRRLNNEAESTPTRRYNLRASTMQQSRIERTPLASTSSGRRRTRRRSSVSLQASYNNSRGNDNDNSHGSDSESESSSESEYERRNDSDYSETEDMHESNESKEDEEEESPPTPLRRSARIAARIASATSSTTTTVSPVSSPATRTTRTRARAKKPAKPKKAAKKKEATKPKAKKKRKKSPPKPKSKKMVDLTSKQKEKEKEKEETNCCGKCQTFDNLLSALECRICTRIMAIPVSLHCGHSFCWNCITHWMDERKCETHGHHADCPHCREPLNLSINKDEVQHSIVLKDLADLVAEAHLPPDQIQEYKAKVREFYDFLQATKLQKQFDQERQEEDAPAGGPPNGNGNHPGGGMAPRMQLSRMYAGHYPPRAINPLSRALANAGVGRPPPRGGVMMPAGRRPISPAEDWSEDDSDAYF